MSKSNKISASFREGQKEDVLARIRETKGLMPFLISLSPEERANLRKMGPKSVEYVRQSFAAAKAFPDELKKSFDVNEMEKDYYLINDLLQIQVECAALLELIEDTMMAAGIDAMEEADEVYDSLKSSAKSNANVKAMVEKISERFKNQGRSQSKTEQQNPPKNE